MKHGANHERWQREEKEKPFDLVRDKIIIETSADLLLRVATHQAF